jgi:hypothetical protein
MPISYVARADHFRRRVFRHRGAAALYETGYSAKTRGFPIPGSNESRDDTLFAIHWSIAICH